MRPILIVVSVLLLLATARVGGAQPIQSRAITSRMLPQGLVFRGDLVAAREWTDRTGHNILLLTRTPEFTSRGECGSSGPCRDREIYAYHYIQRAGGYSPLWTITDFVRECDLDMAISFEPRSIAITDLDRDGVAETGFMYVLGCSGGVDPLTMKLIMHEGTTKYAIRGSGDLAAEIGPMGAGRMVVDAALSGGPPVFRTFAVQQWKRFSRQVNWQLD
jgi:hypothetical protein